MEYGMFMPLSKVRAGALFETIDDVRALKTNYFYDNTDEPMCILIESGEFAHFEAKGRTMVRRVYVE